MTTPVTSILTALINEISTLPDKLVLVLDDYHVIDARVRIPGGQGSRSEVKL